MENRSQAKKQKQTRANLFIQNGLMWSDCCKLTSPWWEKAKELYDWSISIKSISPSNKELLIFPFLSGYVSMDKMYSQLSIPKMGYAQTHQTGLTLSYLIMWCNMIIRTDEQTWCDTETWRGKVYSLKFLEQGPKTAKNFMGFFFLLQNFW